MSQKSVRLRPGTIDRIGKLLEQHYRTLTNQELPPRLREVVRKLDDETIGRIVGEERANRSV